MSTPFGVRRPPALARTFGRLTSPRLAPRWAVRLHRWLYQQTNGRVGHGIFGAPTVLLVTEGRRSGRRHAVALVYVADGAAIVVAASNSGEDRDPDWLVNLQAQPRVEIWIGPQRLTANAHVLGPDAADYERLWSALDEVNFGRYVRLQSQSNRRFPLVILGVPYDK